MLQLSHLKQIVAFFVFIKSTKPNLHYPVCSGCLLHVGLPCIFHGAGLSVGLTKTNALSISNMDSTYTISHSLRTVVPKLFRGITQIKVAIMSY